MNMDKLVADLERIVPGVSYGFFLALATTERSPEWAMAVRRIFRDSSPETIRALETEVVDVLISDNPIVIVEEVSNVEL